MASHRARHETAGGKADGRGTGAPGRVVGESKRDEPESMNRLSLGLGLMMFGLSIAFGPTHAQKQTAASGEVNLTARSANVNEPGIPVRIRILRWSTDEERNPVVAAMTPTPPATAPPAAAGSPDGPGANPSAAASLPPGAGPSPSAAGADGGGAARGGRAAAARGLPAGAGSGRSAAAGGRGAA